MGEDSDRWIILKRVGPQMNEFPEDHVCIKADQIESVSHGGVPLDDDKKPVCQETFRIRTKTGKDHWLAYPCPASACEAFGMLRRAGDPPEKIAAEVDALCEGRYPPAWGPDGYDE